MYVPVKKPTKETAIDDKIQVLKDFCVITTSREEEEIRSMLKIAVRDSKYNDPNIILDRVAIDLIARKLA